MNSVNIISKLQSEHYNEMGCRQLIKCSSGKDGYSCLSKRYQFESYREPSRFFTLLGTPRIYFNSSFIVFLVCNGVIKNLK